jgi:urease beta subunit
MPCNDQFPAGTINGSPAYGAIAGCLYQTSTICNIPRDINGNPNGTGLTGVQRVFPQEGTNYTTNITANTNVKASAARLVRVVVLASAATTSTVCNDTAACAAATSVLNIPASTTVGTVYYLNIPMATGIRVEPGAGNSFGMAYQ